MKDWLKLNRIYHLGGIEKHFDTFQSRELMVNKDILTFADKYDITTKLCLCILMAKSIDFHVYSDLFFPLWRAECDG